MLPLFGRVIGLEPWESVFVSGMAAVVIYCIAVPIGFTLAYLATRDRRPAPARATSPARPASPEPVRARETAAAGAA